MTEHLTKTRPSPSTPARKTREYVQAAAGGACAGVSLCLRACGQVATRGGAAARSSSPGARSLPHPCSCTAALGASALPTTAALMPCVALPLPTFCPSPVYPMFFTWRRLPDAVLRPFFLGVSDCSRVWKHTEYHRGTFLSHRAEEQGC